jgi:hypothetical protein
MRRNYARRFSPPGDDDDVEFGSRCVAVLLVVCFQRLPKDGASRKVTKIGAFVTIFLEASPQVVGPLRFRGPSSSWFSAVNNLNLPVHSRHSANGTGSSVAVIKKQPSGFRYPTHIVCVYAYRLTLMIHCLQISCWLPTAWLPTSPCF